MSCTIDYVARVLGLRKKCFHCAERWRPPCRHAWTWTFVCVLLVSLVNARVGRNDEAYCTKSQTMQFDTRISALCTEFMLSFRDSTSSRGRGRWLSHKTFTADIWKMCNCNWHNWYLSVQYGDKNDLEAHDFEFHPEISNLSLKIRKIKTGSTSHYHRVVEPLSGNGWATQRIKLYHD
jgi:hypothetical protein